MGLNANYIDKNGFYIGNHHYDISYALHQIGIIENIKKMTRDLNSQNDVDVLLPIYYSQERFLIKSINSLISQTLRPKIICILKWTLNIINTTRNFLMI